MSTSKTINKYNSHELVQWGCHFQRQARITQQAEQQHENFCKPLWTMNAQIAARLFVGDLTFRCQNHQLMRLEIRESPSNASCRHDTC